MLKQPVFVVMTCKINVCLSTCQKLRQLLEKDTKLEIENKSSPFIPVIEKPETCNPETPMVQIDSKKEASSKARGIQILILNSDVAYTHSSMDGGLIPQSIQTCQQYRSDL